MSDLMLVSVVHLPYVALDYLHTTLRLQSHPNLDDKLIKIQELQQLMQTNPQVAQNPDVKGELDRLLLDIEARKAILIAEMTAEYAKEENEITGGYGGDPLMKLKARELDLRAMDNERKKDYDEDRIGLDTMKVMVGDQQHDEKLEQNEELAELRAGVSLTKQKMADKSKRHDFGRNYTKK